MRMKFKYVAVIVDLVDGIEVPVQSDAFNSTEEAKDYASSFLAAKLQEDPLSTYLVRVFDLDRNECIKEYR